MLRKVQCITGKTNIQIFILKHYLYLLYNMILILNVYLIPVHTIFHNFSNSPDSWDNDRQTC